MRNSLILGVAFSLAACSSDTDPTAERPTQESKPEAVESVTNSATESVGSAKYSDTGKQFAWNEAGKDALKGKLKDPDSAKFRNVNFYSGSGTPVTCGEVNAKNSFGGYGGFERFIAAGNVLTVMESEMVDGDLQKVWDQFCK